MSIQWIRPTVVLVCLCVFVPPTGAPALAASTRPAPSVKVSLYPGSVDFAIPSDVESALLTVSGPDGSVVQKTGRSGESLVFPFGPPVGGRLQDGTYTWEVRLAPRVDPAIREALRAAREAGDEAAARAVHERARLPRESDLLRSGTFAVLGGGIVPPVTEPAPPARPGATAAAAPRPSASSKGKLSTLDQVVSDDLIVQGSACVGLDCVNNESFGFDTIRLKENNTRIKFDDTSTSPGFPAEDWQLTANDSASGGATKFSIESISAGTVPFTIRGGAPTNSVYVDPSGRVGFRTATPVLDLHVFTSNTPALRLDQSSAGGFTAQVWDVAGNEANFFVRDLTGGSRLPFRIRPGAATSSLDIGANSFVGFGTAAPAVRLDAQGTTQDGATVSATAASTTEAPRFRLRRGNPVQPGWSLGSLSWGGETPGVGFHDLAAGIEAFAAETWTNAATGSELRFSTTPAGTAAPVTRMTIGSDGRVSIGTGVAGGGSLDVNGPILQRGGVLHADYVFSPGFRLESLEEHQRFAREARHLPALAPRTVDASGQEVVELGAQQRGVLEELEKAYLYIERLHRELGRLDQADREKDDTIERLSASVRALEERLARLERLP